jgi:predicted lipoprotein with Yx(FWY)xxD motif
MSYSTTMKRSAVPIGAAVFALVVAACGSSGGDTSSASGSSGSGSDAVQTSDVSGVGDVLVDSAGHTLYFADQESNGMIKCTGACLGFWMPAQATGTLPSDIQGLGTMTRSDNGEKQLTLDGAPLYTFKLDKAPGSTMGNNFHDSFSGVSFTWHAATTSGSSDTSGGNNSGGGGNDNGGYGYGGGY